MDPLCLSKSCFGGQQINQCLVSSNLSLPDYYDGYKVTIKEVGRVDLDEVQIIESDIERRIETHQQSTQFEEFGDGNLIGTTNQKLWIWALFGGS